jgi:hypothetical protein
MFNRFTLSALVLTLAAFAADTSSLPARDAAAEYP